MKTIIDLLEETMNKSSILQLKKFFEKYAYVTKWYMCSDYCIDDPNKPNNVITFVIFPHIIDIEKLQSTINSMQKTDLKNCRTVTNEFCNFIKSGLFFSISFKLNKNNFFDKHINQETLKHLISDYKEITEKWQITTPNNKELYIDMSKKLGKLLNDMKQKSFNFKLLKRIFLITFLASYLKFIIYREVDTVELFSWLSDRDAITSWKDGIYQVFYHITSHNIISEYISYEKSNSATEVIPANNNDIFWDELNRIADFICGTIADFNYTYSQVTGKKQCKLMEDAISSNDFLLILMFHECGIARIEHKRI